MEFSSLQSDTSYKKISNWKSILSEILCLYQNVINTSTDTTEENWQIEDAKSDDYEPNTKQKYVQSIESINVYTMKDKSRESV